VQGLQPQDFQKEQIEGALDEVVRFAHLGFLGEYSRLLSVSKGTALSTPPVVAD
jgi:hypothetical protein